MLSHSLNKAICRVTVFGLIVWLSGAMCLLACERIKGAGTGESNAIAYERVARALPTAWSTAEHACCHRAKTVSEHTSHRSFDGPLPQSNEEMLCCTFPRQIAATALRPGRAHDSLSQLTSLPWLHSTGSAPEAEQCVDRLYLMDRSDTRLRCCVLLI